MKKNNRGFTLVELLAVIVIMGILMMVAIPSVTRTIENSRKDTFVDIAKSYGNAVRTLWTSDNLTCNGVVSSAVDDGDYYVLINSKEGAKESLPVLVDQGGKSSWGNRDVNGYVRVNITTIPGEDTNNDGTYEVEPRRVTKFYVALSDGTHGLIDDDTLEMDALKRGNVVMTLTNEQLKKIEFTLDDGKLNCSRDANGRYSCTNVTPIKNMAGVCVDDNTTVATVPPSELDIDTVIAFGKPYENKLSGMSVAYVFNEDGSLDFYVECMPVSSMPAGTVSYVDNKIMAGSDIIANISSDKKSIEYIEEGNTIYTLNQDANWCNMDIYAGLPMLMMYSEDTAFWKYKNQIKNITFQGNVNVPNDISDEHKWDVSISGNGKVMAYITPNVSNPTFYDLYIQGDGKVYANPISVSLFADMEYADSINNIGILDTSKVTNMMSMFYRTGYNSSTFTLDLGNNFDTSNVTCMEEMFMDTGFSSTVFKLNLGSKFDTSKVINMNAMFWNTGHSSLEMILDLGDKFDTSNVTDMSLMFGYTGRMSPIFTLNLGNKFDTSNVENMRVMFSGTGELSQVFKLDLGDKFDTGKVTTMERMFSVTGYSSPVFTLDLGDKFDTSNVTDMEDMFGGTGSNSSLFTLDCSSWNVDKVTKYSYFNQTVESKVIPPVWKH